jgi:hypothetical protein
MKLIKTVHAFILSVSRSFVFVSANKFFRFSNPDFQVTFVDRRRDTLASSYRLSVPCP